MKDCSKNGIAKHVAYFFARAGQFRRGGDRDLAGRLPQRVPRNPDPLEVNAQSDSGRFRSHKHSPGSRSLSLFALIYLCGEIGLCRQMFYSSTLNMT